MAQTTMYPAKINSPVTSLAVGCTDSETTLQLVDATKLPTGPNLCTLGKGETAETVLYTAKSGNNLTGCTRGYQGTALAWDLGTEVARYLTAYDVDTLKANIEDLNINKAAVTHASTHATGQSDVLTPANIGAATTAIYSASITTTWTGSVAPYSQEITVSGIVSGETCTVDVQLSGAANYAAEQAIIGAWAKVYRIVANATNKITVYATEVTTTVIPVSIKAVR